MNQRTLRLGLGAKLLLAFLIVMAPSMILISYLTYDRGLQLDEERLAQMIAGMRDNADFALAAYLDLVQRTPRVVSRTPYLDEYVEARAALLRQADGEEVEDLLAPESGVEPDARAAARADPETLRRLIESYFLTFTGDQPGTYQTIAIVGRDGEEWVKIHDGEPVAESDLRNRAGEAFFEACIAADTTAGLYREILMPDQTGAGGILRFALPIFRRGTVGESPALAAAMEFMEERPIGVALVDCSFARLVDIMRNVNVGESGSAFVWDRERSRFIVHPYQTLDAPHWERPSLESLQVTLDTETHYPPQVLELGADRYLVSYRPSRQGEFTVGTMASMDQLAEAQQVAGTYVLWMTAVVFILFLFMALYLIRRLTGPLQDFATAADRLADGDFDARVPVRSRDEVGRLADVFNSMAGRLGEYIRELAVKNRIENELSIAHRIQMGLLPREMPQVPCLDIMGLTLPAREVGGDYYDFFRPGHHALGIVMGDVSGKGVPAALLMSATRSSLKAQVTNGEAPDRILNNLNRLLWPDVRENRNFVALFYAVCRCDERRLEYANAGQVFPLLYRARSGCCEYLEAEGLPLGSMQELTYAKREIDIEPGDILLFYTDGCVESMNPAREFFGFDRLKQSLANRAGESARDILEGIVADIRHFTEGHEAYDDITLAIVKMTG